MRLLILAPCIFFWPLDNLRAMQEPLLIYHRISRGDTSYCCTLDRMAARRFTSTKCHEVGSILMSEDPTAVASGASAINILHHNVVVNPHTPQVNLYSSELSLVDHLIELHTVEPLILELQQGSLHLLLSDFVEGKSSVFVQLLIFYEKMGFTVGKKALCRLLATQLGALYDGEEPSLQAYNFIDFLRAGVRRPQLMVEVFRWHVLLSGREFPGFNADNQEYTVEEVMRYRRVPKSLTEVKGNAFQVGVTLVMHYPDQAPVDLVCKLFEYAAHYDQEAVVREQASNYLQCLQRLGQEKSPLITEMGS